MKTFTVSLIVGAALASYTLTGCARESTKLPNVSGAVRQSLDQAALKDVSVDQDRDKGVVTLGGHVASEDAKRQAESIAKSVAGAQVVANDGIVQLDVRQLGAANDSFLRLRGQRIPSVKIVEIFLHDDIAAAGERGVLLADKHGLDRCLAPGILRPIDETQEIAVVKVTEAMHFVHRRNSISETRHDLRRKLEAQIHALRADVEQQVARRRNRMARSGANLPERMQFRRPRRPKKPVPRVGPKPHDAGEVPFQVAKLHRAQQRGEVSAERAHGRTIVYARV